MSTLTFFLLTTLYTESLYSQHIEGNIFGSTIPQAAVLSDPILPPVEGFYGKSSRYGSSISMDGNKALIGAYETLPSGTAFIFENNGQGWVEVAALTPSDRNKFGTFGDGVSLKNDWAFISNNNSVHVFKFDGNNWYEFQILEPMIPTFSGTFGLSISIDGNHAFIGDPNYFKNPGGGVGRVYYFKFDGTQWIETQILTVKPMNNFQSGFGHSVSLSAEHGLIGSLQDGSANFYIFDGQNFVLTQPINQESGFGRSVNIYNNRALIASPNQDSASVYEFDGANWNLSTLLTPNDPDTEVFFGSNTYLHGNSAFVIDSNNLVMGENVNATYFFEYNGIEWAQTQKITTLDNSETAYYGSSISYSDNNLLVSAPNEDYYGESSGVVYNFQMGNEWTLQDNLTPKKGVPFQQFAQYMNVSDHWMVVGTPRDYTLEDDSGAIFVYEQTNTGWQFSQKLIPSDPTTDAFFGWSIAQTVDTIVVGAWGGVNGQMEKTGAVYVFEYIGENWTETQKLYASDGFAEDRFGFDLDIEADQMIVGAMKSDNAATDTGAAYVYQNINDTWIETQKIVPSNITQNDFFGFSVEIENGLAFIGAPYQQDDDGIVYIFEKNINQWTEKQQLIMKVPDSFLSFGTDISLYGNQAAISATAGIQRTAVFIFNFDGINWNQGLEININGLRPADNGNSISLSENQLVIGTNESNRPDAENEVYWYIYNGVDWSLNQKLSPEDNNRIESVIIKDQKIYIGERGNLFGSSSGLINVYSIVDDTIFINGFEID